MTARIVDEAISQAWLARVYAAQGDREESRKAYENFFATWKGADAEIPILRQAKTEYKKLNNSDSETNNGHPLSKKLSKAGTSAMPECANSMQANLKSIFCRFEPYMTDRDTRAQVCTR